MVDQPLYTQSSTLSGVSQGAFRNLPQPQTPIPTLRAKTDHNDELGYDISILKDGYNTSVVPNAPALVHSHLEAGTSSITKEVSGTSLSSPKLHTLGKTRNRRCQLTRKWAIGLIIIVVLVIAGVVGGVIGDMVQRRNQGNGNQGQASKQPDAISSATVATTETPTAPGQGTAPTIAPLASASISEGPR